jgi:hypothetical protein
MSNITKQLEYFLQEIKSWTQLEASEFFDELESNNIETIIMDKELNV